MKQLQELVITFRQKITEADKRIETCNVKDKLQATTTTAQAEKDSELKGREVKVERVESILEIEQKNKETLNQIAQERESLANDVRMHNEQVAKDKAEIEVREKGIKDDFATLKQQQEKLKKDLADLAKKAEALQKGGAFLKIIDDAVKASK